MFTHVTLPLTSLNSTSFIKKLVFRIAFADGVGRVPTNGGGASGKNTQCYDNGQKSWKRYCTSALTSYFMKFYFVKWNTFQKHDC